MPGPRKSNDPPKKRRAPATTPEARENQLIALAVDVAEEQLLNRTASSQVITHFLKLGTTLASLEKTKLERENELLKAKTDSINETKNNGEMYRKAVRAFQIYQGKEETEGEDYHDD